MLKKILLTLATGLLLATPVAATGGGDVQGQGKFCDHQEVRDYEGETRQHWFYCLGRTIGYMECDEDEHLCNSLWNKVGGLLP